MDRLPAVRRLLGRPNRYRLAVAFAACFMAVALATRLTLIVMQGGTSTNGPAAVIRALVVGTVFDGIHAIGVVHVDEGQAWFGGRRLRGAGGEAQ